jgi:hypothetical protein
MSEFLARHDPKHLRSVGEEGARRIAAMLLQRSRALQVSSAWERVARGRIQLCGRPSRGKTLRETTACSTSRTAHATRGPRIGP